MKTLLAIILSSGISSMLFSQTMLVSFPNNVGSLRISEGYNLVDNDAKSATYVDELSPLTAIIIRGYKTNEIIKHPQVNGQFLQEISTKNLEYLKNYNEDIFIASKEFANINPNLDAVIVRYKCGKFDDEKSYIIKLYEFINSYVNYHPMSIQFIYGQHTPYEIVDPIIEEILDSIQCSSTK